jgi:hypothetical protein
VGLFQESALTYAIQTGSKTVTTSFDFECFEIGEYIAFKATARSSNSKDAEVHQGIATKSGVRTLKQGKFPNKVHYGLLTDEQIEGIQQVGWNFLADYRNAKINKAPRPDIFDYLVAGGNPANVLRTDGWNQFYDLDDVIVPTAVWFDYIQAHIDNSHYDLAKVVDILRTREDIVFFDGGERQFWKIDADRPEIKSIPSYNAGGGSTQYVPFFWRPSLEVMQLLEADMSNRYKTIFDQDLLGLRAGGAALFEGFYNSTPYECGDDDGHDCSCL